MAHGMTVRIKTLAAFIEDKVSMHILFSPQLTRASRFDPKYHIRRWSAISMVKSRFANYEGQLRQVALHVFFPHIFQLKADASGT